MPPSPLGLLEERRETARARVEELEAELKSARAVLERRVVAMEELAEALAPAGDAARPHRQVRRPPSPRPCWRGGGPGPVDDVQQRPGPG